jgi:hypothetical protein
MSWLISDGKLQIPWASLSPDMRARFSRHEPSLMEWGLLGGDAFRATWEEWAQLGALPATDEEELIADWASLQEALSEALEIDRQDVSLRSVGYVGATGADLTLSVGNVELPTTDPFVTGWLTAPPLPTVAQAHRLLRTLPATTRQEQLVRWARIRNQLEVAVERLTPVLTLRLDPHLEGLTVLQPRQFGLRWQTAGPNDNVASLEVSAVGPDGTMAPIDLAAVDEATGIVSRRADKPILLPEAALAVARSARKRQRQIRRRVEGEMRDPALVIPEGIDADGLFDLSNYSPRVAGFELSTRREPPFTLVSSRTEWFQDDDASNAFIELVFERSPHDAEARIRLGTVEDAHELLEATESALGEASESPGAALPEMQYRGVRLGASAELSNVLHRAIQLREERLDAERQRSEGLATRPTRDRYTAVIRELPATPPTDQDGIVIDESHVPWDLLRALMRPNFSLKSHQRRGVAWLWHHSEHNTPGVLLADDMGLGKTLQVASFLALRMASGEERPALLVVPTIILDNWSEELERFFWEDTFTPVAILHGPGLRRFRTSGQALDVETLARARLVITNYETLASHQISLLRVDFSTIVFDEAQALKNETTFRSRAAQGLKRVFAVALTGTPVENRLSDLWAIYEAIEQRADARSFGSRADFEQEHERQGVVGTEGLRRRLRFPSPTSSVLRREKSEALRDLPPKTFHEIRIPMTHLQYELERVIAREFQALGHLATLDRLRKLYQHPRLLDAQRRIRLQHAQAIEESPKTRVMLDLLRNIADRREKALVFTQWIHMQDLLAQILAAEFGLATVRIINGAPANRGAAQRIIREFSDKPGFDVLVLSPLAAGIGLTITAANHVIHYGRWWNPAKEDQATDRAYRIGQTKEVHVYHLLLHHPGERERGFDVKLHELVERKRRVARDFLAPAETEGEPTSELDAIVAEELGDTP